MVGTAQARLCPPYSSSLRRRPTDLPDEGQITRAIFVFRDVSTP